MEMDISDDDASTTDAESTSERSSGTSRTTVTRSFVWADADSDDDDDFLSSVASAAGEDTQQSILRASPSCIPRVPPGCNQPFHFSGAHQKQAMVVVSPCSAPCATPACFMGAGWLPNHVNRFAVQSPEGRSNSWRGAEIQKTACDGRSTLIVKNLPLGYTHFELCRVLDEVGLSGLYNFVYVPFDFKKSVLFRYGFVNFAQHEQAVTAMKVLAGFSGWMVDGEEGCEVDWSAQQGLYTVIERYRNNQVMHSSVPDAYKPLLFKSGVRIAFPAPTQAVTPPKHMSQSVHANADALQ